ncbi:MAG TPA: 3-oxoacyl-[acyl-carrier-protein] reductase [candidate division Zixibacteria bacterium]|nr:3-oxoacyl-[acyl-carrier-protein] reductase [candidate division Zixibacteria bacterium]
MYDFTGKTALITGSGQGIGKEIAGRLAAQGATVMISDINPETTAATAAEFVERGLNALSCPANVTDPEQVETLVGETVSQGGSLDILVNNAGITRDALLVRMSDEDWDRVIAVNLRGSFLTTRAAAKVMMKQRRGRIVNIASVVGVMGNVGQANYSASKAGLIGLTKSAARELAPRGVTVNAVAPGFIKTDMTEAMTDQAKEAFLSTVPLKREGLPADVAAAVCFLSSDEASYITGQVISVCGGLNI